MQRHRIGELDSTAGIHFLSAVGDAHRIELEVCRAHTEHTRTCIQMCTQPYKPDKCQQLAEAEGAHSYIQPTHRYTHC